KKGNLRAFDQGDRIDPNEMLVQKCDVLAPCAVDRVITEKNAGKLQCRILAEGANGPTTPEADKILDQRWDQVFVIPDILCNAGALRALLARSIDYAGMFPPCQLELEPALKNQAQYLRSTDAWMLSAFVLPVQQFGAAKQLLTEFDPIHPLQVSALGPKTENA